MSSNDRVKAVALISLIASLGLGGAANASGTYTGRPPHPPASIDRAAYELGKHVFAGEFTPGAVDVAAHEVVLLELQQKLPTRARVKNDITAFVGKLSDAQLDALQYFLLKRYKVK